MNKLSQDLIRHVKAYDSHPCADIIRNCITIRFGNAKMIKTQEMHT